jgi:hypothetical protein
MRRPATSRIRSRRINRRGALFDVDNFSFFVHYKRSPIRHSVRQQNPVSCNHFTVEEIAQQRERRVKLGGEFLLGRSIVCTDAKNLGVVAIEFCNTSLVCGDFARSTTGKSRGKKRQYYRVFTAKAGKSYLAALRGRQSEVRRHIPLLQGSGFGLDILSNQSYREQSGCECKLLHHGNLSYYYRIRMCYPISEHWSVQDSSPGASLAPGFFIFTHPVLACIFPLAVCLNYDIIHSTQYTDPLWYSVCLPHGDAALIVRLQSL